MKLYIVGAGAIGGTIGALMTLDGHDVTLCDADAAHVEAINNDGLRIEGPVNDVVVRLPAIAPDALPFGLERVIVAVKSHHTRVVAELLAPRLTPDGCVLTVQNGLTADVLQEAVGESKVISSFINFGADLLGPGRILQGNIATFRVGELSGGIITPRVQEFAEALDRKSVV